MIKFPALLTVVVCLAACGGRSPAPSAAPQRLVHVEWIGSESFRVRTSLGLSILTNPFAPGSTEFSPPKDIEADIVLITDEDSSRNYVDGLLNNPRIFRGSVGMGTNSAAGVRLLGVPVFADPEQPVPSQMSVMYRWISDGLKFGFIGNLRSMPTEADFKKLGALDVLFIPASGGVLTAANRLEIIRALNPTIIIPTGSRSAVSRFAGGFASVHRLNGSAALLSRDAMPVQQTILVFR